jgi:hypothetical protein
MSRAILLSFGLETENAFTNIMRHSAARTMPVFVESFFLWNISASFMKLLPALSDICGPYFATHFEDFSPTMQLLVSAHQPEFLAGCERLTQDMNWMTFGNQAYLLWLGTFVTRILRSDISIRHRIVIEHVHSFCDHLNTVTDLLVSSFQLFDPLIDRLLCFTASALLAFFLEFVTDSMAVPMFRFLFEVSHFILGMPVTTGASASAIEALNLQHNMSLLLRHGRALFAAMVSSDRSRLRHPAMALILAELPVDPKLVNEFLCILLKSGEPVVFSCAAFLVQKHVTSELEQLPFHVTRKSPNASKQELGCIFMRLCLLLALALENAGLNGPVLNMSSFCSLLEEQVVKPSLVGRHVALQEAIVFFLGAFYRAHPAESRLISLDLFRNTCHEMSSAAAGIVLHGDFPPLTVAVHEHQLCLPWRRTFIFQHLLEEASAVSN